jgi:uncharacterized protein (TIGR03435 family)
MMKTLAILTVFGLSINHCHCQTLAFEVASITPCTPDTPEPPGEHMGMVRFIYPGGNFTAKATSIKYLLEWAYGILPAQHSGGPSWLETQRYDILAKAPADSTDHQMKLMVRTLLADRFKLKLHTEEKEVPVILVSLGKNEPKLYPAKEGEVHSLKVMPQMGPDQKPNSFHVVATRFSLEELNETFARQLGRVIVDQTGLKGEFDFALDMTPDEERPNPLDPAIVIGAMRDQLGLTVKSQKGPVNIYVIDSIEMVPAGN